jgi:hypothetical protein
MTTVVLRGFTPTTMNRVAEFPTLHEAIGYVRETWPRSRAVMATASGLEFTVPRTLLRPGLTVEVRVQDW